MPCDRAPERRRRVLVVTHHARLLRFLHSIRRPGRTDQIDGPFSRGQATGLSVSTINAKPNGVTCTNCLPSAGWTTALDSVAQARRSGARPDFERCSAAQRRAAELVGQRHFEAAGRIGQRVGNPAEHVRKLFRVRLRGAPHPAICCKPGGYGVRPAHRSGHAAGGQQGDASLHRVFVPAPAKLRGLDAAADRDERARVQRGAEPDGQLQRHLDCDANRARKSSPRTHISMRCPCIRPIVWV